MLCLPGSDGPIRRRSFASSIAKIIDWGAPIGGQTIIGYDDLGFLIQETCQRRTHQFPGANRQLAAPARA